MKTIKVSEAALDTMETMVLKLQQENDMLLAALKAIVDLDDGDAPDLWHYQTEFEAGRAAIAKVEQVQPVFERMGLEQPGFPGIRK